MSPTLHLPCGLPGAGKTTLARRIEGEAPALRLTGDEWLKALFPQMTTQEAEFGPYRARIEKLQWNLAARALDLGRDVVLDWGIWSRAERDTLRAGARQHGARVALYFLDAPIEELWARVSRRNARADPGAFVMTRDDLIRWAGQFERPTAEELRQYDSGLDLPAETRDGGIGDK
ncbi:AAA family ATPase [Sphingopyxis sp. JAI128]|uniref:AAA family ATPase n=1 Tax=Sphingopyxis sp. JAI128 TaxID=2723066 RepID=UPI00161F8CE4|nr:AAA family ATPase [Sphingopyxis sp. JAI128]MBB6426917.1 putative kinase [Sphingopyxis sp. JAI128]